MRNEDSSILEITKQLDDLDVSEPRLPRRRKMPKRLETGNAPPEFATSEKELHRQMYYDALDLVVNCAKVLRNILTSKVTACTVI